MLPDYFNLQNRFYYNRLNQYEKSLYTFFLQVLLMGERKIVYLPSAEYNHLSRYSDRSSCFYYGAFGEEIDYYKVWKSMIYDCPELYFVYHYELLVDRENHALCVGDGSDEYSDEEISEIDARLEDFLHKFDDITDPFELELAVHDYITEHYGFDFEGREAMKADGTVWDRRFYEKFTAVGLLRNGVAVCGGFIKLLQFVLQRRGLEVANIIEIAGENGNLHSWLAIKLDGEYYHLDLTFNEGDTLYPDLPQYKYFNVTDEEIVRDHEFPAEKYPEILCQATKYNYYYRKNLFLDTQEKITEAVNAYIASLPSKDSHGRFYFRTPKSLELKQVSHAIGKALHQNGMPMTSAAFFEDDGYYSLEFNG